MSEWRVGLVSRGPDARDPQHSYGIERREHERPPRGALLSARAEWVSGPRRWLSPGGPKRGKPAQVTLLFLFLVLFSPLFLSFFFFDSNLNLNLVMSSSFELITQIQYV